MDVRIGTRVTNYPGILTTFDEPTVSKEQILETPITKAAVTSIDAKKIETTIPTNEYLKHKGTDFAKFYLQSLYASSINTGGLSDRVKGSTAGSIYTGGLNDSVPVFVQGQGDTNSVAMNDIHQGQTGDCWMMAPLATLAQKDPEAIKRMIQQNPDGTYTVTFKERQWPLDTYVDRKVTVSGGFPNSLSQPGDKNRKGVGEIWPQIIEKAYAKYKGGYDKINGGNPAEFLEALTGRPSNQVPGFMTGMMYPFQQMENDFNSGKSVVLGTYDKGNGNYGLVPDHAYALNRIYTDPTGRQMVELYNPWGNTHPQAIPFDEIGQYFETVTVN
jgi:hypothetical protein